MCIWPVKPEDRHCEYCLYRGGCDKYFWTEDKREPIQVMANKYIKIMSDILGKDVTSRSHGREVVWGRNMIMYMLRVDGYKTKQIADIFGMVHTSAIYACQQVEYMLKMPNMHQGEIKIWQKFLSLQKQ